SIPGSEVTRKSTVRRDRDGDGHHGDVSSWAEHHPESRGIASPRTMAGDSDAISELSTESFTSASSVDDGNGRSSFHQPSNEPPSALLMAPPFVGDTDAVNILQGRARRSEIQPASPRSKHSETHAVEVTDAARILVAATKRESRAHGRLNPNNNN
ncbi:unnamed protein product, partial [Laminaria digitata]